MVAHEAVMETTLRLGLRMNSSVTKSLSSQNGAANVNRRLGTRSRGPNAKGPRHARVHPAGERGRRIRWRTASVSLYPALEGAALWTAHIWGWPEVIAIPVVAIPYWAAVTAVWSRYGPEMAGMG